MQGWVKIHRTVLSEPYYKNERLLKLWLWFMLRAAHEEHEVLVGIEPVTVKPGQTVFGLDRVSAELEIPRATLYRYLKTLEKLGVISVYARRNFSIVTLTEWGVTQQGARHERDADETPMIPYNKEKNEKNEKKFTDPGEKSFYASFVSLTDSQYQDLVKAYGEEDTRALIELLNNHKGATGKTYKDDYFAILSWCVDRLKSNKEAPAVKSGKRNKFINYTDEHTDFSDVEAQAIVRRRQARTSSA